MKFEQLLTLLLILSFLTAGISPACHFISGTDQEGLIEICTSDGEIQTISLSEAGLIPDQKPQRHNKQAQEQCVFCFSASNAKYSGATIKTIQSHSGQNYRHNGRGIFIPNSLDLAAFDARGPPNFLLRIISKNN